jgi:hypothetical protein
MQEHTTARMSQEQQSSPSGAPLEALQIIRQEKCNDIGG